MSGFILNDKQYEAGDLRELQVKDQIRLERWLAKGDLTDARSFEDIVQIAAEVSMLPEPKTHPDFKLFVIIGVWVAMLQAGEDASLNDCGAYGWGDLTFIRDDEPEGKAPATS
jgi:hypothetical protein